MSDLEDIEDIFEVGRWSNFFYGNFKNVNFRIKLTYIKMYV